MPTLYDGEERVQPVRFFGAVGEGYGLIGAPYVAAPAARTDGTNGSLVTDNRGNLRVAFYSGATPVPVLINSAVGVSASTFGMVSNSFQYRLNGTTWDPDRKPSAASRIPSAAASVNATSAKASAGDLHMVNGYNAKASVVYIKFYNKATAPTVGTDVPVLTLACPPSAAFSFNLNGYYFSTGIAYGLTTDAADAGTTALLAGDVLGLTITYA